MITKNNITQNEQSPLNTILGDLYETCLNLDNELSCNTCESGKVASCRGRFPSFLYRLLDTIDTHYINEQSIKFARPNVTKEKQYLRTHHQAHNDVIKAIELTVAESHILEQQALTAKGYRLMYQKISYLLKEHNRSFDKPLHLDN